MNAKQRAAQAALAFVSSGMVLGLGTGSTADFFLLALGDALANGKLRNIRAIPTSRRSQIRAAELAIPLIDFGNCPRADLTIDGADEISPSLDLIKGLGGALLREKIVAQNSARLIIIADASKTVPSLGHKCPLPVEVATFAYQTHEPFLRSLGSAPVLRLNPDGTPYLTDGGNYVYDCRFPNIPDPAALESTLFARAGILECGLFLGLASMALIADDEHVDIRQRTE